MILQRRRFSDKNLRVTMFWVTAALLLLEALVFWRESLFYLDGAKVLYELIQRQSFSYMHNRYWMAITQVMPILAVQDGASPLAVYYIQSLSFLLPPLITLVAVGYWLKDARATALVLFFSILGTNQIHYIKEWGAYGALYLLILLASFLQTRYDPQKLRHNLFAAVLIFLTLNTHPTTLCFFLMMPFLWHRLFNWKRLFGYAAVVGFSFFVVVTINIYVYSKVSGATGMVISYLDLSHYFTDYLVHSFTFVITIVTAVVYLYEMKVPPLRRLVVLAIPLAFCLMVAKSLNYIPINLFNIFYYETQFFLIFVAVLFFPLYRLMGRRSILVAVFALSVVRFFYLNFGEQNHVHQNMILKEELLRELKEEYPEKRAFILHEDSHKTLRFYPDLFPWYESYLMSSYLLEEKVLIYLTNDTTSFMEDGRKVYYYRTGELPVNPADSITFSWRIDPAADFPELELKPEEILAL